MINTVEKIYSNDGEFLIYKVVFENGEISSVPHEEANRHYQAIQEWIAAGNTVIDNPPQENE